MSYGHAERNLVATERLVRETAELLSRLPTLDHRQRAWLRRSAAQLAEVDAARQPWA